MSWPATDRHHEKQGRSTGRLILTAGRESLVVYLKRHWKFSTAQCLAATFLPSIFLSPAGREWQNLVWAGAHGFAVPDPLACGEFLGPWLGVRSFLVVRELGGMLPLHEAIPLAYRRMSPGPFARWKRDLIRELARIAARLHKLSHFHKDFYLCHFYIPEPDGSDSSPGKVHLIDWHRLGRHSWMFQRWQVKDLAQFLFSTWGVLGITSEDRLFFFHAYLRAGQFELASRRLAMQVLRKARRYARHNRATTASTAQSRRKAA
jgi:heptose I phosphotransferase